MTYDEIMENATPNYMHGKNVRVIATRTGRDGFRETTIDHSDSTDWRHTYQFGIRNVCGTWMVYYVDWRNDYGHKHYDHVTYKSEADALARIVEASDRALRF